MSLVARILSKAALATLLSTGVVSIALADTTRIEVWKSPACGCCEGWIDLLKAEGFVVVPHDVDDVAPIKAEKGITAALASCHTAMVDGWVVEGHVPAADIRRLLAERPAIKGIAAPGMPAGAPGMGSAGEPYDVVSFDTAGTRRIFSRH